MWSEILKDEISAQYFLDIIEKVRKAREISVVLPSEENMFRAFSLTKFDEVKVVIIGQDPYSNVENATPQANGLAFSVPSSLKIPPSLRNIFIELNRDLNIPISRSGELDSWAKQGVFLLNSILSVEFKKPLSHKIFGWERFTNSVILALSSRRENLVFMLWGNYAKQKRALIDEKKHLILESAHPSPLARGFVGCGHFGKCNEFLSSKNLAQIDWRL